MLATQKRGFIGRASPGQLEGVNQQETSSDNEGSSEATRDITYEFNEYSNLIPQKKLTYSF